MRLFILPIIIIGIIASGHSQSTFSKRYHLDLPSVVFSGIEQVSDSTYLLTGVVTDTLPPYLGASIAVLVDEQGNELNKTIVRATNRHVEAWTKNKKIGERVYKLGYDVEPGVAARALLIGYSLDGEPLFHVDEADFRDTATFFIHNDLVGYNEKIYVAGNNSYVGEGDNWWGATLTIYDGEGTALDGFVYETPDWRTGALTIEQVNENFLLMGGLMDDRNRNLDDLNSRCKLWAVDTLGNLLWTWESLPGELQQGVWDMTLTSDGGIVVATGIGEEIYVNPGTGTLYWSHCIYKLNTALEEEWRTMIRTSIALSYLNFSRMISLANDGGYIAVGEGVKIYPDAEPWVENTADFGGIIAKVAPNGDSLWARVIVDPTVDTLQEFNDFFDIIETADGGFLIAGESSTPHPTEANQQGWLLKLDEWGCLVPGCHLVSAVDEPERPQFELLLYPNPVSDQLAVYLGPGELPRGSSWIIYNAAGQQLDQQRASVADATYLLPVAQLAAGTYWLQLRGPNGKLLGREAFVAVR